MRELSFEKQFRKDLRRMEARGKDINKLEKLISYILKHGTPPPSRRPHKLHASWSPALECHIENNDWLLIYTVTRSTVHLYRTGSHDDLFD